MAITQQLEEIFDGHGGVGGAPECEDLPQQHPKRPSEGRNQTPWHW